MDFRLDWRSTIFAYSLYTFISLYRDFFFFLLLSTVSNLILHQMKYHWMSFCKNENHFTRKKQIWKIFAYELLIKTDLKFHTFMNKRIISSLHQIPSSKSIFYVKKSLICSFTEPKNQGCGTQLNLRYCDCFD